MKLKILLDNNTIIDRYFQGEPGVSYYLEADGLKILFDTGYSDLFIKNAYKMDVNLNDLDYVVISHGHIDHSWGLVPLIGLFIEAKFEEKKLKRPKLVAHPEAFLHKKMQSGEEIGSVLNEENLGRSFDLQLNKKELWLSDNLVFLGEIERSNDFENKEAVGQFEKDKKLYDDFLLDDSALVYKSREGLVIITGCSHSGICNIIEYAKKVCRENKIADVIGGFHLLDPSENQMENTVKYFDKLSINKIHACHCTDLNSKIRLSKAVKLEETGVGLCIEYK